MSLAGGAAGGAAGAHSGSAARSAVSVSVGVSSPISVRVWLSAALALSVVLSSPAEGCSRLDVSSYQTAGRVDNVVQMESMLRAATMFDTSVSRSIKSSIKKGAAVVNMVYR
jgi:hypothetical protein